MWRGTPPGCGVTARISAKSTQRRATTARRATRSRRLGAGLRPPRPRVPGPRPPTRGRQVSPRVRELPLGLRGDQRAPRGRRGLQAVPPLLVAAVGDVPWLRQARRSPSRPWGSAPCRHRRPGCRRAGHGASAQPRGNAERFSRPWTGTCSRRRRSRLPAHQQCPCRRSCSTRSHPGPALRAGWTTGLRSIRRAHQPWPVRRPASRPLVRVPVRERRPPPPSRAAAVTAPPARSRTPDGARSRRASRRRRVSRRYACLVHSTLRPLGSGILAMTCPIDRGRGGEKMARGKIL
jgi:hypothetical protein